MKSFIKSLFIFVLLISISVVMTVSAKPTVKFDSETIKSYTDIVSTDVAGVATLNQTTITSYNKRVIVEGKLADHKSYWLEPNVSLKDSDLRVVNYTSGSNTNWQGKRPTELAKIYEADTDKLVEEYSAKMTIETTFESESHIADGTTFKHELDCEVAEGFELVYSNNEGSAQGKYYSKAELVDGVLFKKGKKNFIKVIAQ